MSVIQKGWTANTRLVYEVKDKAPVQNLYGVQSFLPSMVVVSMMSHQSPETGRIAHEFFGLEISGQYHKKDGTTGQNRLSNEYGAWNLDQAPEWVLAIIEEARTRVQSVKVNG